ncbi:MAG TPA: signal protein, partial [Flavobacteriales bacterium]|nr:signal protein [Flavobacteriales bacterium]
MRKKIYTLLSLVLFSFGMTAQTYEVSGTVTDTSNEPLPGVSIVKKGTNEGTTTDFNGKYKMEVSKGDVLEYTMVGYKPATKVMDGSPVVNVTLEEGVTLDEVVVTGNRAKPRTILDSPVPIDNINARELESTGKVQVEQMLAYKVPSFNAQTQPISDATAHFDPADLRGLGPSRTLVLING